ncbi:MAG: hypothetical protein IPK10_09820 [Bacteroidetes bacterium]|nr:hypothetical protein [Bacteroidota bacterium]
MLTGSIVTDLGISLSSTHGVILIMMEISIVLLQMKVRKSNVYCQNNIAQGSAVFTQIFNEPFVINSAIIGVQEW